MIWGRAGCWVYAPVLPLVTKWRGAVEWGEKWTHGLVFFQ